VENGEVDGVVGIYFDQAKKRALVVPSEEIGISIDNYDYGELNEYIGIQIRTNSGKVQEIHSTAACG
jgi:hypothetical protein